MLIGEELAAHGDAHAIALRVGLTLERQPDQKGDRVRVTMSGKFLPYKQY